MDLEVARADRGLHAVAVPSRLVERLRDRGLARAEEAEHPAARRLCARETRSAPARTSSADCHRRWSSDGGPGSATATQPFAASTTPGAVPASPSEAPAGGQRRLLAHARREVGVRPAQPLGDPS